MGRAGTVALRQLLPLGRRTGVNADNIKGLQIIRLKLVEPGFERARFYAESSRTCTGCKRFYSEWAASWKKPVRAKAWIKIERPQSRQRLNRKNPGTPERLDCGMLLSNGCRERFK